MAHYTKYIIADELNLKHRPYPASRGRLAILANRDIIRLFSGLRVSDSFLMKTTSARFCSASRATRPADPDFMMARPVIALLTDFGLRDHYAGSMKAVALGICPDATFVDISHEIAPHDVFGGALELDACYRDFPPRTIFLVVIDPGVGSTRRGIVVDTGDHRFVGPDNGVFSIVLDAHPSAAVVELTERRYARPVVSRTFEGRDRFAPAAAWLACGLDSTALGRPIEAICRLEFPSPRVEGDRVVGEVIRVDRFGNLVTNIDRALVESLAGAAVVDVGDRTSRRSARPTRRFPPMASARSWGARSVSKLPSMARAPPPR